MTILELLERKVIPWVETNGLQRLAVADRPAGRQALPEGMKVSRVKLKGKRVAVKGPRLHGQVNHIIAVWPQAGLTEVRLPFLACMTGSRVDYPLGDQVFHCSEGDFLLVPPRTPHPGPPVGEQPDDAPIHDVLSFSTWDNHRQCCVCYAMGGNYLIPNATTVQLLDTVLEELTARRPGFEKVAANLFLALLHLLCREFREQNYFRAGMTQLDSEGAETQVDPIQRVRQYIATHLDKTLTIDDACNQALMSRTQFTRRFREVTGLSFIEYVTQRRLEQAKVLLHETEWSLAMVSEFIGFQDTTRLHRIFDRYVGMSPSQYRSYSRQKETREKTR